MLAPVVHPGGPARIVYLGTPEIAVAPLRALVAAGHDVCCVVTNPDRKRGRGGSLSPSPVKSAALELGLPVRHDLNEIYECNASLGVVVAYGHLISTAILERLAMVNIHFSLLPRWRGAAPLERAILAGDDKTGTCLMQVVEALDAGPVFARREVSIGLKTLDELRDDLVAVSCEMLIEELQAGLGQAEAQSGDIVHAAKLVPEDHRLDLSRPAIELARVVRLGRAFTTIDGVRLRVHRATAEPTSILGPPGTLDGIKIATGDGALVLDQVQPEGRKKVDAASWRNGARLGPETRLGT